MTTHDELVQRAHAAACAAVHERYPLLAMARVYHSNKRGEPLNFADKPYLIPLYAMAPDLVHASFSKAVQTGISELMILLMLYAAGWQDRIAAYVLPQYRTSGRFVSQRIDTVLARTPAYMRRLPGGELGLEDASGKGNLHLKRFGRRGSLLFLGSNTPADFLEFSADLVIVDEYDDCDQTNLAKVRDRVRESAHPQLLHVSNPQLGGGITTLYNDGSQTRWFHRCDRCGHRQALDWFQHFVRETRAGWEARDKERAATEYGDLRPVCARCHQPFDRRAEGALWVSAEPRRKELSFHISRLDVLATARNNQALIGFHSHNIKAQGNSAMISAFWRGVLGLAYTPSGSRVTDEVLDAASKGMPPMDPEGGDEYEEKTVLMGVDVGSVLNVKISVLHKDERTTTGYRRDGAWVGAVLSFDDLIEMAKRYHVDVMVIDALPETREAKRVRDYFIAEGTTQVWLCRYFKVPRVGTDAFGIAMDFEEQVVTVDRTQVMDDTMDELRYGRCRLPGDVGAVQGFADQMKAPVRRLDVASARMIWDEGSKPDHYRHADVYERVAQEIHDRSGGFYD